MYSELVLNKGDKPIAEIIKKKDIDETKNYDREILYIKYLHADKKDRIKEFILTDPNKTIYPINVRQGDNDDHVNRIYIAGGTLSGKSFLAGRLARSYNRQFPSRNVILFSWVDNDEAYKGVHKLKKIRIDEEMLENPIDLKEELRNSLVIFDDIEHYNDKDIKKELEDIRDACINAGRHEFIDTIVCRQNFLEHNKTKTALNSAFQAIGFPKSASRYQFSNWLERYMKFDKKLIKKILKLPSRWVLINITFPMYILFSSGCILLD